MNDSPKALLVAASSVWFVAGCGMVTSVVRGKVTAVRLGPAGVGMIGQLNSLSLLGGAVAMAGIGTAAMTLIGRLRSVDDADELRRLTSYVILRSTVASLVVSVALMAASMPASHVLFGTTTYWPAVAVAAPSVPMNVFSGCVLLVLQAQGRAPRAAMSSLIALVINTVVVISTVVAFGLHGAVASVLLTSLVPVLIIAWRERSWLSMLSLRGGLDRKIRRDLYAIGLASFTLGLASNLTDLGQRSLLVHLGGRAAGGYFQVFSMASNQGYLQVMNGIMVYLAPALAVAVIKGASYANRELDMAARTTLAAIGSAAVVISMLAPAIVRILFSDEFLGASNALIVLSAGEMLRAVAFALGSVLLPLGLKGQWLAIGLATLAVQIAATAIGAKKYGVDAVAVGFWLSWLMNAGFVMIVAGRRGIHLPRMVMIAFGVSAIALVLVPYLSDAATLVVGLGVLCLVVSGARPISLLKQLRGGGDVVAA
jgi:O-antigen/teichoic acid export membrane protein